MRFPSLVAVKNSLYGDSLVSLYENELWWDESSQANIDNLFSILLIRLATSYGYGFWLAVTEVLSWGFEGESLLFIKWSTELLLLNMANSNYIMIFIFNRNLE